MVIKQNYVYDGMFSGNILIVGRTACRKTYFTQKLALNNFFSELKKVEWISYIEMNSGREAEIESCFSRPVEFHYPKELEKFNDLLEVFKACSKTAAAAVADAYSISEKETVNIGFGEKTKRDQLIVMDKVSGLADKFAKFASFLIVARKFNYICIYIFHTIYPEKTISRTTFSQTNIFDNFPESAPLTSVQKTLEGACIRKTRKYIPQSALWISRLFTELANRDDRVCLTLDCSGINKDSPGRFRT